ncbi:MAG: hypothetical protein M3N19_06030 [Candidatus Eremiobacteraeota bacterium]|nr:hypothetical protein [Candidatus Eremiobacteraeota bacterium]
MLITLAMVLALRFGHVLLLIGASFVTSYAWNAANALITKRIDLMIACSILALGGVGGIVVVSENGNSGFLADPFEAILEGSTFALLIVGFFLQYRISAADAKMQGELVAEYISAHGQIGPDRPSRRKAEKWFGRELGKRARRHATATEELQLRKTTEK